MSDTTQTPDDEFSAAFAELQTPNASSTTTAAAAPAAPADASVSPSAAAAASTETPAAAAAVPSGEAGNPSAGSAPATPAASAEAPTSTAAQPAATPHSEAQPDYAAQIAELTAQLTELKKGPAAAAAPAPAATPTPVTPASPFTPDEQAIVDSYIKEWPDMARGEMLLRRAEYGHLVQHIYEQLRPRLEALEAGYETSSTRTQYQDLVSLVPDYDDVRDKTLAWIDQQPAYLKTAYQQVANQGSAKDVADLITRFKKETGYVTAAGAAPAAVPAAAAAPAAPVATAGLAPAAAAAATSLRVVKSSRSDPISQPDMNDFDAAFKEAVGG